MHVCACISLFTLLAVARARPVCPAPEFNQATHTPLDRSDEVEAAAVLTSATEVARSTVTATATVVVVETVIVTAALPWSTPGDPAGPTASIQMSIASPITIPSTTTSPSNAESSDTSRGTAQPVSSTITATPVSSSGRLGSAPTFMVNTGTQGTASATAGSPLVHVSNSSPEPASSSVSALATSSIGSKRGVIANPIPGVVAPFTAYPKISWDMNWWHGPPPEQPTDWLFVPQLTHLQPDQYWPNADFRHNVTEFPYIAGFLEPNGQVSIEDAVQSWKTNLEPLASSHTLIPPMVGQNGLSWLQNFTAACTGCTLDQGPIAFTVYASADEGGVADFKHHITQFAAAYPGRDLWAANIGVLGQASVSEIEWLMRQLVPYLDNEPAVTRYAWNGAQSFWDEASTSLTPLARLYATL